MSKLFPVLSPTGCGWQSLLVFQRHHLPLATLFLLTSSSPFSTRKSEQCFQNTKLILATVIIVVVAVVVVIIVMMVIKLLEIFSDAN